MTKRIQKIFLALAAIAALAVGGSAVASGQSNAPAQPPAATAPAEAPGTEQSAAGEAAEAPGTEQPDASEAAEQPGSESAVDSDGPGGHADEPGNANANHQFEGVE
jgi:hypothetical protein